MSCITLSPNDSGPTVEFAGQELLRHLHMLHLPEGSLSRLQVTLEVQSLTNVRSDSYYYNVCQNIARFQGSCPRAVLLGVYDYLRSLGFVFHHPGENGTFVPEITDPRELDRNQPLKTASFLHRGVCIEGADSLQNVLAFIDWLPKNGYNAFFLQFKQPDTFFERWYHHVNNPLLPPEALSREALDRMAEACAQAMALRGITHHRVGHGWTAAALGCDATGWDREQKQLSPEALSMTALVNGQRGLFHGVPTNTNLCYANPTARENLISQVVSYAASHPSVDCLHFWLADMPNNVCECPSCRETTLSDQYVSLLNELDQALTARDLPTRIVFLLYQELLYAPLRERIHNPDRFILMFAPISRTFEKSYPRMEKALPVTPYVRNRFRLPQTVEENLSHYFRWKEIFKGECFFYDYPLGRAHYGDFGYMKIARVIYDDIHALHALGSDGYMSCQELRAMTPTGFPSFVMGQALLDSSLSWEALKETYFSSLYQDRWETVVQYLEQLSFLSDTDYFNGHGERTQPQKQKQFLEIFRTARDFLTEMDSFRITDPRTLPHWDFLRFHGRYTMLLARALSALCIGDKKEADRLFREFADYVRQQEPARQAQLDVYRVIEVAVGYTGFSQP